MTVEFRAGDKVKCTFFGDEVFELVEHTGYYPLKIKRESCEYIFQRDGRYCVHHTSSVLTLVSRPKKKESVTWYRVTCHAKEADEATDYGRLFRNKEHFLVYQGSKEQDFHFIHLEPVVTHEYDVGE